MKTLFGISIVVAVAIIIIAIFAFIVYAVLKSHEEKLEDYFKDAYDCIFWLQNYLRDFDPSMYRNVAQRLDGIVDILIEVEQIVQNGDGKDQGCLDSRKKSTKELAE